MKLEKSLLIVSCLFILASCNGYKRNAFLEKGNNDGRFYFENGQADIAYKYLIEYDKENNQKGYIFTDDRREKIKVGVRFVANFKYWTIPVKVNDVPLDFFLDTGTGNSSLSYDSVKIFGKNYDDVPVFQKDSDMFAFFPKTFSFGNICLSYPEFVSWQLNTLHATSGTLGLDHMFYYFNSFTLDLRNKSIIFNDDIPDVKGVKFNYEFWLIIPVKINDKTYNAMLDTGCYDSITFLDLWNDEQLEKYEHTSGTWHGNSKFQLSSKNVKDIIIGDAVIEKLTFDLIHETESNIFNSIKESGLVDIILGSDFFRRTKVTVDTKNEMCYVVSY